MGSAMALNLLKSNFDLLIYDVDMESDRIKRIQNEGGQLVNSPAELARDTQFILMSLPTPSASEKVVLGVNGVLEGASEGTVIIELSTVAPSTIKKIADACLPKGVSIIDAPVSGGRDSAQAGSLTIMVGGDSESFQKCLPILNVIGKKVRYVGKLGSGETVKLLNNMLALTTLVTCRSALEAASAIGLDLKIVRTIIEESSGQSWVWTNWVPRFLEKEKVYATIDIIYKDLTEALGMLHDMSLESVTSASALNLIRGYIEEGMGKDDISAIFDFLEGVRGSN